MVRLGTVQEVERDECRLLPAAGLSQLYRTLGIDDVAFAAARIGGFDKRDVADIAVVSKAAAGHVDGHAVAVETDVCQVGSVIIFHAFVLQRQHGLVFCVILVDGVVLGLRIEAQAYRRCH